MVPAHLDLTRTVELRGTAWIDRLREYDARGNLKVLRGPDNLPTTFEYLPNGGLLSAIVDPVQGRTELDIDARYNLPTAIRRRGLRTVTVPDAFGRPQERRWESMATGTVLRYATFTLPTDGTSASECQAISR